MATTPTVTEKPKFELTTEWLSQDGSWKTATSERNFDPPDEIGEIEVAVIGDDGKTSQGHKRSFKRLVVRNKADLLKLLQDNPLLAMQAANYGLDLYARSTIKGPIAGEVEGPGKAIKKLADQIFASRQKIGKPITLERALELAASMADLAE